MNEKDRRQMANRAKVIQTVQEMLLSHTKRLKTAKNGRRADPSLHPW